MQKYLKRPIFPYIRSAAYAVLLTLLIAFIFQKVGKHLIGMPPATCMPNDCFCESIRGKILRQPINAISSLSFVLVGIFIIGVGHAEKTKNKYITFLYPILLILIGIGSFIYHATLTLIGQFLDVAGMYGLAAFIIAYALYRRNKLKFWSLFLLINIILDFILLIYPESRRVLFGAVFIAGVTLELYKYARKRFYPHFGMGLFIFVIAYIIWILDRYRVLCSPASFLQGHSIWHIFGALSSYFLFLYYIEESK